MTTALKAIQTVYKGYKFRSRLEARYAVLFDTLDVKWEYEKQGYNLGNGLYYLPDFWLPEFEMWVEVKGGEPSKTNLDKIDALEKQSGFEVALVGNLPDVGERGDNLRRAKYFPLYLPESAQRTAVSKMFSGDYSYQASDDLTIVCPECAFDYVHFDAGVGVADVGITIHMSCENGHEWYLCFRFHKGQTDVRIESLRVREYDFFLVLANNEESLRDKAVLAARQARFEHGEKG